MRALRRSSNAIVLDKAAPEPAPAPGDAVVRPIRVGIASLDLQSAAGDTSFEGVLGHEFVGVVERVEPGGPMSEKVAKSLVGRRVVGSPSIPCGMCDLCRSGLRQHCRDSTMLGVRGRDGCFADAFAIPASNLVELPREVDDDAAVFAHALAGAIHAAQQIRIEGRPYITILGDGRMGLLCAQVMSKLNASVRVVGRHERKLALCDKWGVKSRLLADVGRRADQDIVIECTGSTDGFETAMRMVRPRGKILLKSRFARAASPIDLTPIVDDEIEVIGSTGGSVAEAVRRLAEGAVDVASLITRRMKLDDGADALRIASDPEQIKVVMDV